MQQNDVERPRVFGLIILKQNIYIRMLGIFGFISFDFK